MSLNGSVRLKPDATTDPAATGRSVASGFSRTWWPNGNPRTDAIYKDGAYEGEYRSWYANGRPYEGRHYVAGHEAGLQQGWRDRGTLFINYEARDGRHYGMENSTPCVPPANTSVPFFQD